MLAGGLVRPCVVKSLFLVSYRVAWSFKSQKYFLRMVPYLENVDSSLLTNKKDGMAI